MRAARSYQTYEDFERDELRGSDRFHATLDELLDDMFSEELDFGGGGGGGAGSRRKAEGSDVDDDE